MWIYIFEDCEMCGGKGKCPGLVEGKMVVDAKCDMCEGMGRRPTNMSFMLPARLMRPGSVDAALEEMLDPEVYP